MTRFLLVSLLCRLHFDFRREQRCARVHSGEHHHGALSPSAERNKQMTDLTAYRDRFSAVKTCHYLISNSLGAMPDRVNDTAAAYCRIWAERGVRAWEEEWWLL
ncbi:MAG: hypothetical protein D6800_10110, partial [Candidatus Zixiibacteriota bacterium]